LTSLHFLVRILLQHTEWKMRSGDSGQNRNSIVHSRPRDTRRAYHQENDE